MSGPLPISPAMLALIRPQLKQALEALVKHGPPAAVARDILPELEALISPALHPDAAELLAELAAQLTLKVRARERTAARGAH